MLNTVYKSHLYKSLYKDLSKFARKNLKNVELDREYWLHKLGVTPYRPTRAAFGGMSLFLLGAVAGGIAGILFTPKTGTEMRTNMKDRARMLVNKQQTLTTPQLGADMPVRA